MGFKQYPLLFSGGTGGTLRTWRTAFSCWTGLGWRVGCMPGMKRTLHVPPDAENQGRDPKLLLPSRSPLGALPAPRFPVKPGMTLSSLESALDITVREPPSRRELNLSPLSPRLLSTRPHTPSTSTLSPRGQLRTHD